MDENTKIQGDKNKRERRNLSTKFPYYIIFVCVCNRTRKILINFPITFQNTTLRRQLTHAIDWKYEGAKYRSLLELFVHLDAQKTIRKKVKNYFGRKSESKHDNPRTLYKDDHEHSPDAQEDGTEGGHS